MSKAKAKITLKKNAVMDYYQSKLMMDFFGMLPNDNPNVGFLRFPPGISVMPNRLLRPNQVKEKFLKDNLSLNTKLDDFQQMYQKFASSLIGMNESLIPPGHPLFSRTNSTTVLNAKNEKLRKENLELKKQLGESSKIKSN